jgi:hypothetical protein
MMRLVYKLILALTLVLGVGLLGCTSTTDGDGGGDGDGDGGDRGLGWAMDIAEPIRDTELPGGSLIWILNDNITDSGEIDQTGLWALLYVDRDVLAADEFIGVFVYYDGTTIVLDEDDLEDEGYDIGELSVLEDVPSYRDAEPWVTAAEEALDGYGDLGWTQRVLNVFADNESYSGTDNIAFFMYIDAEGCQTVALVWVDADTNEMLEVVVF